MIHISTIVRHLVIRHEYWEAGKFNLPIGDKDRKPYYVCYEYRTTTKGYNKVTNLDAVRWIENLIHTMKEETSGKYPDTAYKEEVYSSLHVAIETLKKTAWIPLKTRPMTEEEIEHYKNLGYIDEYGCFPQFTYDCPLPDEGQEVLITDVCGNVREDTFHRCGRTVFSWGFEENDGEVLAWMPKPESYKEEGED